jgi:LysM repeat protein
MTPPVAEPTPPPYTAPATGTEHVIAKGDSFYSIGKKYGVTIKAIADANPGVDSAKLQIGQKIKIPAATAAAPAAGGATAPAVEAAPGTQTYTVKSGDTLTAIAAKFGVTIRALRSANNLSTDRIKVGDKLKIPAKAAAPAPAPVAAPVVPEATPTAAPTAAPPR